jgi:carbon-monoxide dehydrogenase small subunit
MTAIGIEVNGHRVNDDVEARLSLADFLRERCGLTATHLGCEHGACGACTVVVDGLATRSCLALAVMADGRKVQTLEGLRSDALMVLLRRHFHEHHALQCGFCTPGMLISARDILLRHVRPTAETVRHELSGQICRCTGYANIVKAIVAAGEEVPEPEPVAEEPAMESPAEAEPIPAADPSPQAG